MPKIDAKTIQRELDDGWIWPVYWVYGPEALKAAELVRRIRTAVLGSETSQSLSEERLDGTTAEAGQIVDSAHTASLFGGLRFLLVRDAHAIKGAEILAPLLGPKVRIEDARSGALASVCVFVSKDLDARKKSSKLLLESAAVVHCEEVAEKDRDAWIAFLAKRRNFSVSPDAVVRLIRLEPWRLNIVDSELEKLQLLDGSEPGGQERASQPTAERRADEFADGLMERRGLAALAAAQAVAQSPENSFPLLGRLAWNVRHLRLWMVDGGRTLRLSPFLVDKLRNWSRRWTTAQLSDLQRDLCDLDLGA